MAVINLLLIPVYLVSTWSFCSLDFPHVFKLLVLAITPPMPVWIDSNDPLFFHANNFAAIAANAIYHLFL